jgi:hypothetical protein
VSAEYNDILLIHLEQLRNTRQEQITLGEGEPEVPAQKYKIKSQANTKGTRRKGE